MESTEEHLIVEKAKKGDRDAFGMLYDRYNTQIYRFVFLKVTSRDDAEDITHQVFMNAWINIRDYRNLGFPFSSWLYRIARNQVIDYYRTSKDHVRIDEMEDDHLPASSVDMEDGMDRSMVRERVRRAIKELKPGYQDVVIMRFVEDMSIRDVAKALQKSEGAIKLMQHRAVAELKKLFKHFPKSQ